MDHIKKDRILEFFQSNTALVAVVILFIFGSAMYGSTFLNYSRNIKNVLKQASLLGIMGVGVNLCFLIGARDLSVGATAAAVSMVTAQFCNTYGILIGIPAGLITGMCFGLLNGYVISRYNVQPFIATLGTQLAARGVALLMNNEFSISLKKGSDFMEFLGNGSVFNCIPVPLLIFVGLIVIMSVILKYTPFGRAVYAVGGNEEAAEMMGIRTTTIKLCVFVLSGLFAALSGIVLTGRLYAGQPTACEGWEMTIMAAIVIGGTNVKGGSGKISGIFCGAVFVQLISNLINLNGHVSVYWKDITTGIVLLMAVFLQAFGEIYKEKQKNIRLSSYKGGEESKDGCKHAQENLS